MTILQCLPPCNQPNYEMQQKNSGGYSDSQFASIQLTVESFTYASYTENYVWGVEDIIGALGGVISLWLGIDIKMSMELIGSAIYLLYSFVVTCRRKDDNSEDNNRELENANEEEFRLQTIVIVPHD
jgi:hypothetical protein